jgi:hypothetical protein
MLKKIIASIILACFIFVNVGVHVAETVHAQNTWYYQDWTEWFARVYDESNPDEIFGERYTAAQVEWIIYGLFGFIINHVVGEAGLVGCIIREKVAGTENWLTCVPFLQNALNTLEATGIVDAETGGETEALASTYPIQDIFSGARPISGIGYIKNAASNFGLASEVKAQGFGFEAASSMRTLWVAIRNVTYFFLILLIIAMAFMIMFRFKISPQTVITVQSALPRIIIALILITFSYAIAGFMIDLLYVVIGLIAAILSTSGLFGLNWPEMYNRLSGATLGTGIIGTMMLYFFTFVVIGLFAIIPLGILDILFRLLTIIILVVLIIALIFITFKIMWMLLKAYVSILLLIAVGPIYIITGGFTNWLKNLAANLAVFAVIGPMFAISFLFIYSAIPQGGLLEEFFGLIRPIIPFEPTPNTIETSNWTPPFLNLGSQNVIWLFASFVIMTLIPNAANIIKSMIQGRPFGYGTAVGAALGAAAGVAAYPFQSAWGATSTARSKAFTEMVQTRAVEPLREMFRRRTA